MKSLLTKTFSSAKKERLVKCRRCQAVFSLHEHATCPDCRKEGYSILIYDQMTDLQLHHS